MSERPTTVPNWASDATEYAAGTAAEAGKDVIAPSAPTRAAGWTFGDGPVRQFFNWLFRKSGEWIAHFDERRAYSFASTAAALATQSSLNSEAALPADTLTLLNVADPTAQPWAVLSSGDHTPGAETTNFHVATDGETVVIATEEHLYAFAVDDIGTGNELWTVDLSNTINGICISNGELVVASDAGASGALVRRELATGDVIEALVAPATGDTFLHVASNGAMIVAVIDDDSESEHIVRAYDVDDLTSTPGGWSDFTTDTVHALAIDGERIYVGGDMTSGGSGAAYVRALDMTGSEVWAIDGSTNILEDSVNTPTVNSLATDGEILLIGHGGDDNLIAVTAVSASDPNDADATGSANPLGPLWTLKAFTGGTPVVALDDRYAYTSVLHLSLGVFRVHDRMTGKVIRLVEWSSSTTKLVKAMVSDGARLFVVGEPDAAEPTARSYRRAFPAPVWRKQGAADRYRALKTLIAPQ